MNKHNDFESIEEIVETIEHWKISSVLKQNIDNDLNIYEKFKAYWKLLKEQLYLYEQHNENCIFKNKRQYYAARHIVREYSVIAKNISEKSTNI
ncbi:hypothetical protein [Clostridium septicum]|uniref:hypothetical protein n=1 Tax=Clostridium septicum TaxID=1504 RepID=UPI000834EC60|nr:hypothetical protein [Clostridium septicum]